MKLVGLSAFRVCVVLVSIFAGCADEERPASSATEKPSEGEPFTKEEPASDLSWDERFDGQWKVIDSSVESIQFSEQGAFRNKLRQEWMGKDSFDGQAQVVVAGSKPILKMTLNGPGGPEKSSFEADFVDDDLLVLKHVIYPPVTGPGVTAVAYGGQVMVRMDQGGKVNDDAAERAAKLSQKLFPPPTEE